MAKPSLFIGSSSKGLEFAKAIKSLLKDDVEATVWNEGVFRLGVTFIESLMRALPIFDFAALVLTPDDLLAISEKEVFSPRDNVIFEMGLFMGRLGRERTFIVAQKGDAVKIPTDLSGVALADYIWSRDDQNHQEALRPACELMRAEIQTHGFSPTKVLAQVHAVEAEQKRQKNEIDALSFVVSHFLPLFEMEHLAKLQSGEPFPYRMQSGFEREIRHLWELGFIAKKHDFYIRDMSGEGDLRDYFSISEHGTVFLTLQRDAKLRQQE